MTSYRTCYVPIVVQVTERTINSLRNQDNLSCNVWFHPPPLPSVQLCFLLPALMHFISLTTSPFTALPERNYSLPFPEPLFSISSKLVLLPEPFPHLIHTASLGQSLYSSGLQLHNASPENFLWQVQSPISKAEFGAPPIALITL